jgi:hypothetical protein
MFILLREKMKMKMLILWVILLGTNLSQVCMKYECSDLSDNSVTDGDIPFCVYRTVKNPGVVNIDDKICKKSKSP